MKGLRVWTAVMLACLVHGRAAGQVGLPKLAPAKPATTVINTDALPKPVVGAGQVKITYPSNGVMHIQTSKPNNVVNWESFNIGSDATVKIGQSAGPSAVLLNNIVGKSQAPTVINGALKAMEGQSSGRVYIYDPAGIVFGAGASVNLNSLIASTLRFDEARLQAGGLLMPGTDAALRAALEDLPSGMTRPGSILVEGGASITVDNGGQLMLAAPGVYNAGKLYAPDGQVILAAGDKVYLASPDVSLTGSKLRGLVVEVQNASGKSSTAENAGEIKVDRGNASMVGYAVNQMGTVSAKTSVNLNGSIYLKALDTAQADQGNKDTAKTYSSTGTVQLGANSRTEILPFDDDKTLTLANLKQFNKSEVQIIGKNISLLGGDESGPGAQILAKGGAVDIQSVSLPANTATYLTEDVVRVTLGQGSLIDVSGMNTAKLGMASNIIEVDLRGTELADNVLLRDSPMYGKKINIDIRKGTGIANIDGWLKLVEYKLDQVNTEGGSITINSQGAVIQQPNSLLRLDGGGVNYLAGYANASQLKLGDSIVDVASAKLGVAYAQIINAPNGPANFEPGYFQGSKAGSLSISAQVVGLGGDMSATTSPGFYQRNASQAASKEPYTKLVAPYPTGGNFALTVMGIGQSRDGDAVASLRIGNASSITDLPDFLDPLSLDNLDSLAQMTMNINSLSSKGFRSFSTKLNGNIWIDDPLNLPAKASLNLSAETYGDARATGNLTLNAPITAPGGSVSLAATNLLELAPGMRISTGGRWTNDAWSKLDALSDNVATNAGNISLTGHQIKLRDAVALDASAGAWLDEFGKVKYGNAGTISLIRKYNSGGNIEGANTSGIQLGAGANFSAYGFSTGGQLVLRDNLVNIASAAALADTDQASLQAAGGLLLDPAFFSQGGFSGFEINSLKDTQLRGSGDLTIWSGAQIKPSPLSLALTASANRTPTGDIRTASQLTTLPLASNGAVRPSSNLSLIAGRKLSMAAGTAIAVDPQSIVNLLADDQLTVLGSVAAPAGRIVLGLTSTDGFDPYRGIWLGAASVLNAGGSAQRIFTNGLGVSSGEMLDGGLIQIGQAELDPNGLAASVKNFSSANGFIVAEKGARLNADGLGPLNFNLQTMSGVVKTSVAGNAGTIDIRSSQGMLLAADLSAKASPVARGGTLNLVLDNAFATPDDPFSATLENPDALNEYPRVLNLLVEKSKTTVVPKDLVAGAAFLTQQDSGAWYLTGSSLMAKATRNAGEGWVQTSAFAGGGFGRLQFKSRGTISFNLADGVNTLSARDAVILDAPVLLADRYKTMLSSDLPPQQLSINAPFVQIGGQSDPIMGYTDELTNLPAFYSDQKPFMTPEPSYGWAGLVVNSTYLDLTGATSLKGFSKVNLNSLADTRVYSSNGFYPEFRDQPFINANPDYLQYLPGQFSMVGELVMRNAQIYAGSLSQFRIDVLDSNPSQLGSLKFQSNGQSPNKVYAAGGSFTAVATNIVQAGVVKAPLGNITMGESGNTRSLVYAAGSLTSVKGEAEMLYGTIENGSVPTASSWRVSGNNGSGVAAALLLEDANPSNLYRRALPSKKIYSFASAIDVTTGAVLDASKGGKLLAYEFTPGKQGSSDILNGSNTFAILPGFQGSVAPVDPNNPLDDLGVGDKLYLSATAGLAAGTYTLLPAHYALLPGGFSVKVNPNSLGMTSQDNQVLPDGTALVSGSLLAASQTKGTLRGFQLMSGDVIRKKSEFNIKDAQQYFTEQASIRLLPLPELPIDAGYMQFLAGNTNPSKDIPKQLSLNGRIQMVGGSLDISVLNNDILLVDSYSAGLANVLSVDNLNQMQISSLLVGGVRETMRDGTGATAFGISKLTKNVTVNNPGSVLSASDIMLVAEETLQINAAASLSATAAPKFDVVKLSLGGDAAMLRVTGGADILVEHTAPLFAKGQLNIQAGARITTSGSAYLDATKNMDLAGWTPSVGDQGLLGFAARGIHIADTIAETPINGPQLQLQADQLRVLNKPGQRLSLNSYDRTIGFASNFALGKASDEDQGIAALAVRSAGLQTLADDINVTLRAKIVNLQGLAALGIADDGLFDNTSLAIDSQHLTIGDGVFALGGFKKANLTAANLIKGSGDQGFLVAYGDLSMTANSFSAESGKSLRVVSKGDLTLGGGSNVPSQSSSIGGELAFTAAKMLVNANISLPSGLLTFNHADDQQNFNVAAGSLEINGGTFNLSGARQYFGQDAQGNELWADAPGGSMVFNAASIALNGGRFDVSAVGAAAGSLSFDTSSPIDNPFTWSDLIELRGGASQGHAQGQFSLSTKTIGNFSALNDKVRMAGFTESLSYRQTSGDLVIAKYLDGVGDLLKARSITLSADQGSIDIAGTLDASGLKGGNIAIYAAQAKAGDGSGNIVLRNTALLNASSTASTTDKAGSLGRGGSVLLSTSTWDGSAPADTAMAGGSFVDLQGGLINTNGGLVDGEGLQLVGKDGSVLVRVPRTNDNRSAAMNQSVGTQFVGAKPTLEAFSVYFRSEVTAADFPSDLSNSSSLIYSDAKNFADNLPSALSVFNVRPGVEIRSFSDGNLTLSVNELDFDASLRGLDLSTWRFNGQPINLTLRAAGDLTIKGSISDGFVNPNTNATYNPYLPNANDGADRSGMAMPNWALGVGPSADINLVAGANFQSANPMATLPLPSFVTSEKGNFTLGFAPRRAYTEEELLLDPPAPITINDMPVALVRTGTGSINLSAARDVTLELLRLETLLEKDQTLLDKDQKILVYANQTSPFSDKRSLKHSVMLVGASIYTAGEIDSEAYDAGIRANIPHNVLNPHYLGSAFKNQTSAAMFAKNGGGISIRAGRHIQGPVRKGGLGSYQNGDYNLPIEWDVETFFLYEFLPDRLDDFDLATSKQLATALNLANAEADKIIDELRADTDYQSGSIKTLWAYDAYIPVIVTDKEGGAPYADDYVFVSDMIDDDEILQTAYEQKLELLKSGKLTQKAAKKTLDELTKDIIQRGVELAEAEATRLAAELLTEFPDDYRKTGIGNLLDTAVVVTAFLNDEHFTTRDWAPTGVSPLVNNWLFRQGRSNTNASGQSEFVQLQCKPLNCSKPSLTTAWFARPDYFNQSMATLGGGDLNIKAGGAVRDIYASTATNAYMTGGSQAWALKEQGGGDLTMSAGGDIAGAAIYVQKGMGIVSTQSSIVAGDNLVLRGDSQKIATYDVNKPVDARLPMGTIFAMGDAQLEVTARKNLTLAAVYNPMLTEQSKYNRSASITRSKYIKDLPNVNENDLLDALYPVLKYPFYPKYQDANYWNTANDPANSGATIFKDFDLFQENFSQYASFSTYTPSSSMKLLAMTGATALVNDGELVAFSGGEMLTNELVTGFATLGLDSPYTAAPSLVKAVAMSGGLRTQNGFAMMPSTNPQLNLWAQGDITLNNGSAGSIHAIDVKPESLSSVLAPRVPTDLDIDLIRKSFIKGGTAHAEAYAEASNPSAIGTSSIVSLRDVVGDSQFAQYSLNLARPASIMAGRDILSLGFVIQHLKVDDISLVKAGRDISDETRAAIDCTETNNASICVQHVVTGPGVLLMTAGRDIDLGNQAGIVTRGNLDNPYLPEGGASIQLTTAGLMPDYGSLKTYTQTFNKAETLQDFVAPILQKLGITPIQPLDLDDGALQASVSADLKALESPKLTDKERIALYFRMLDSASYLLEPKALQDAAQNQLLVKVLGNSRKLKYDDSNKLTFALLNTASKLNPETLTVSEQNKRFIEILNNASLLKKQDGKNLDLTYFDGLIASLFPTLTGETPVGNLSNHSSQIKTEQGGSIDIFTSTGSVFAGLTMGKAVAKPSNQGLFTVRGGDINALVKNDFLVNQGRVFTLGGGDITLVSQFGNLEAGKGAKTASSAPPPLIVIGKDGSITVDVSGSVAGSGIATLSTKPGQPISDVNTVAPRGYVDAGDAGIQSTGNVNINSPVVRNADNIAASSGVSNAQAPAVVAAPAAPPPPPAASGNAGDDAKKSLASTNTSTALANLSVELLGFGDVSAGAAVPSAAGSQGTSSGEKDKDEKDEKDKDEKSQ